MRQDSQNGNHLKINPKWVTYSSLSKSVRQVTSFTTHFTTTSPSKHHVLPSTFRKNPCKNHKNILIQKNYALPRIFAAHHRDPTSRNRQSFRNSGGLPSMACPRNCSAQPKQNRPTPIHTRRCHTLAATSTGSESIMIGIPNVCVSRF